MTITIKLTDTQRTVLLQAADRIDGNIEPLPPQLKGGTRQKVIDGLTNRGLAKAKRNHIFLTDAGYAAVDRSRPVPTPTDDNVTAQPNRARADSKQAQVIAMLKRPEGATIAQICAVTEWQSHTVRGAFAGAFKKKLGLEITSAKESGADRIYKITT